MYVTWRVHVFLCIQTEHSLVAKCGHFEVTLNFTELCESCLKVTVAIRSAGFGLRTGGSTLPKSLQR